MTRVQKVAMAQRLRAEGLLFREIAERMGAAKSTVDSWINDPDGSRLRARKDSYRGECVDCGGPTNGSDGRAKAPARCAECSARYQHENAYWTPETVVAAIQEFARLYGHPPSATDFAPALAAQKRRPDKADRYYRDACYPATNTATAVFGTWNAAIRAAGFEPHAVGQYGRDGEDMGLCCEIAERYEAGESSTALAIAYGCSARTIGYRIHNAGGQLRAPGHRAAA